MKSKYPTFEKFHNLAKHFKHDGPLEMCLRKMRKIENGYEQTKKRVYLTYYSWYGHDAVVNNLENLYLLASTDSLKNDWFKFAEHMRLAYKGDIEYGIRKLIEGKK